MSYQELKDLKKANVLHIDVRERWEIERDGKIPASINIPCKILALLPGNVCWCSLAGEQGYGRMIAEPRGLEET